MESRYIDRRKKPYNSDSKKMRGDGILEHFYDF